MKLNVKHEALGRDRRMGQLQDAWVQSCLLNLNSFSLCLPQSSRKLLKAIKISVGGVIKTYIVHLNLKIYISIEDNGLCVLSVFTSPGEKM